MIILSTLAPTITMSWRANHSIAELAWMESRPYARRHTNRRSRSTSPNSSQKLFMAGAVDQLQSHISGLNRNVKHLEGSSQVFRGGMSDVVKRLGVVEACQRQIADTVASLADAVAEASKELQAMRPTIEQLAAAERKSAVAQEEIGVLRVEVAQLRDSLRAQERKTDELSPLRAEFSMLRATVDGWGALCGGTAMRRAKDQDCGCCGAAWAPPPPFGAKGHSPQFSSPPSQQVGLREALVDSRAQMATDGSKWQQVATDVDSRAQMATRAPEPLMGGGATLATNNAPLERLPRANEAAERVALECWSAMLASVSAAAAAPHAHTHAHAHAHAHPHAAGPHARHAPHAPQALHSPSPAGNVAAALMQTVMHAAPDLQQPGSQASWGTEPSATSSCWPSRRELGREHISATSSCWPPTTHGSSHLSPCSSSEPVRPSPSSSARQLEDASARACIREPPVHASAGQSEQRGTAGDDGGRHTASGSTDHIHARHGGHRPEVEEALPHHMASSPVPASPVPASPVPASPSSAAALTASLKARRDQRAATANGATPNTPRAARSPAADAAFNPWRTPTSGAPS